MATINCSEIFKILADETRLRVLNLFLVSKASLCACEIVDALEMPQYTISKHLAVLGYAGLVDVEKDGLWGYYHLKRDESKNGKLLAFLQHYLTGETFETDGRNLEFRLSLRNHGKCVVGFVPQRELLKLIKERTEAAI